MSLEPAWSDYCSSFVMYSVVKWEICILPCDGMLAIEQNRLTAVIVTVVSSLVIPNALCVHNPCLFSYYHLRMHTVFCGWLINRIVQKTMFWPCVALL